MKKTLSQILLTLIITVCISFFASVSVYAADNILGANDSNDYWGMIQCCDQNDTNTSKTPVITLTFSEDGTKITKVETSGYYTNTSSERLLTWNGMGFGITDAADPAHYFNRWLFKGTDANGFCKADDSLQSSLNYLSDAYILYSFTSNNCYDKSSIKNIVIEPKKGNIVNISGSYELTDSDNSKLDPNKVYYVHFILQGWAPGENNAPRWGTLQKEVSQLASFKISDNVNYRYSANFNYNGHGGTNFTLPIKKNSSVSSAIAGSVDEKWTTEQKGIVTNWQTAVTAPTAVGCAFQGWYEDQELTTSADFTKAFGETNGNRTYYAKWEELDYTITKETTTNGSFTVEVEEAEVTKAKMNKEIVITPTSNFGYDVDKVYWKKTGDSNYTEITNNSGYKFTMPDSNVNIKVTFKLNETSPTSVAKIGNTIFDSVSNAVKSISDNGTATIELLRDSIETETINIYLNKTITLDLNGHMIKGNGNSNVITVNGSTLIVNDTNPSNYHYFIYKNDEAWTYLSNYSPNGDEIPFESIENYDLIDDTSVIKICGGIITGGIGNEVYENLRYGGAIYVTSTTDANASVTLNNGFIVGNSAYDGGGIYLAYSTSNNYSLNINGAKIIGNFAGEKGGGIDLTGSSDLLMNSGYVSYNVTTKNHSYGAGICAYDNSSIVMNDGYITNNIGNEGAGLRIGDFDDDSTATFTMNGGVISNNYAYGSGGGVYTITTFILNDGDIKNNTAIQGGGGVLVMRHDVVTNNLTINGGEISGNNGCGVYAYGKVTLDGNPSIINNTDNSATKNLCLYEGKTFNINDDFVGNIGISVYQPSQSSFVTLTSKCNKDFSSYFTSDNSTYSVLNNSVGNKYILVLGVPKSVVYYSYPTFVDNDISKAVNAWNVGSIGGSSSVALYNEITSNNKPTTLTDGWYVLKESVDYGYNSIVISGDVNLVLLDGVTLKSNKTNASSAAINVSEGNSLTIYSGCETSTILGTGSINIGNYFQSYTSFDNSAGIGSNNNENCGSIIINGGNIIARGLLNGSGIGGSGTGNASKIYINGGSVTAIAGDNYTPGIGGGTDGNQSNIFIKNGNELVTLAGQSDSGYNSITSTNDLSSDSLFLKRYVYVGKPVCEVGELGAGVLFSSVTNALLAINDDTATTIHLIDDTEENISIRYDRNIILDLNGYLFIGTHNSSVINNNGILTIDDSYPNSVHNFKVNSELTWELTNDDYSVTYDELDYIPTIGTIIQVKGGCITNGFSMNVKGAGISNNKVDDSNSSVILNIKNGNIIGNYLTTSGAGIYADANSSVTISGGRVIGNSAGTGGGIRNEGNLSISDNADISFNRSINFGGGINSSGSLNINDVYTNTAVINMTGGKVFGNSTYQSDGGGIYNEGSLTISGTASIAGNTTPNHGGGICNVKNSSSGSGIALVENVSIDDNSANRGGGMYNTGTLTVDCATIKNNIANGNAGAGGGIYNTGSLTINNASSIINNSSSAYGGGIYNLKNYATDLAILTMNNGTISDNTSYYGGGIYNLGYVTLGGTSSIDSNDSNYSGGGIYNCGLLTINDNASISNNTSNGSGGGIYNYYYYNFIDGSNSGVVIFDNGDVINNNASNYGGGVYNAYSSSLTMNGSAHVSNNTTEDGGAGIYNSGSLDLHDNSYISDNNATNGKGGGLYNSGSVVMDGLSSIFNNISSGKGGGVYNNDSFAIRDNASILNNTSSVSGGGVYNTEDFVIGGSAKIINNKVSGVNNNLMLAYREPIYFDNNVDNSFIISVSYEGILDDSRCLVANDCANLIYNGSIESDLNKYYISSENNNVYLNGRIVEQPNIENDYTLNLHTTDYEGTFDYQWYRVSDNSSEISLVNNNSSKLDLTNVVFGKYKCLVTAKINNIPDFVISSSMVNIVPCVLNQPARINDYLLDVDLDKCDDLDIDVSYNWYENSVPSNHLVPITSSDVTFLNTSEVANIIGGSYQVSGSYNSITENWSIEGGTLMAFKTNLNQNDKVVISGKHIDDSSLFVMVLKNDSSHGLIEYDECGYGYCGTINETGSYTFILANEDSDGFVGTDVSIGIVKNSVKMNSNKVTILDANQISVLRSGTGVVQSNNDGSYAVTNSGGTVAVNLDAGETVYITTDDGLVNRSYIYNIDNSGEINERLCYSRYQPFLGYTALDSGTYYLVVNLYSYDEDEDEYNKTSGNFVINTVGKQTLSLINGANSNKLDNVVNGTYLGAATYTDSYGSCTIYSDPFSYVNKKVLQVVGATVLDKEYDGNFDGKAQFSMVKGIALDDIGKVNVSISSVTFDDNNIGNNIPVTIEYEISGDENVLCYYSKPNNDTSLKANITRKDIIVKAKDIVLNKGDLLPNNSSDFVEPIEGILNNYQVIYTVSPISNTNTAGIFRTIVSGNTEQDNYHINFVNGSVNVVDNNITSIAKTDPKILSKVLDQYLDSYPDIPLSINLSVSDASGSVDERMNLNEAGNNNRIDSYESKIYINLLDGSEVKIDVTDTGYELIPIEYDFDFERRYDVHVWRTHDYSGNKVVEEITFIPNSYGEFVVYNYTDKLITVWAKKYSTYSITYKELQDSKNSSSPAYQPVKTCVD